MRNRRGTRTLCGLLLAVLVAACGGSAAVTPPPTAVPTPTPTPNPHLAEPVTVRVLMAKLAKAKLGIVANNAGVGPDGEPRAIVNATYDGWPLEIREYSSSAALLADGFAAGAPQAGDRTYVLAGLNILVAWGPDIASLDGARPDAAHRASAIALADALDPLLGPLAQATIDPVPIGGVMPTASPSPTPEPTATPKPAKTPKPKKTPKP
jgi:hypothetical protein